MIERPIIFNGEMVQAILSGKKTQTRRVMKDQPQKIPPEFEYTEPGYWIPFNAAKSMVRNEDMRIACPFGLKGHRLWVRETFGDCGVRLVYRADSDDGAACKVARWTPSIHMPRSACRLELEITDVRIELLNSISEQDALSEGMDDGTSEAAIAQGWFEKPVRAFQRLWEQIYGLESWSGNPWVWVIEFKPVQS